MFLLIAIFYYDKQTFLMDTLAEWGRECQDHQQRSYFCCPFVSAGHDRTSRRASRSSFAQTLQL
jgi:hypothetical protein